MLVYVDIFSRMFLVNVEDWIISLLQ